MARIQITRVDMPREGAPLRFAVITDLHRQSPALVAARVKECRPDAALIVGDLMETPPRRKKPSCERGLSLLRLLRRAGYAVFYSPGNHDATLPVSVREVLAEMGVQYLADDHTVFRGIRIGGLSSAYYRNGRIPDTDFLARFAALDGYKLLLCHHPEYYPTYLSGLPIDCIVAGHAHGGQWRLFGRGIYSPGQGLFPRYTGGVYDGRLVVSRGVGDSVIIPRVQNPREIILLTVGRG